MLPLHGQPVASLSSTLVLGTQEMKPSNGRKSDCNGVGFVFFLFFFLIFNFVAADVFHLLASATAATLTRPGSWKDVCASVSSP